MSSYKIRVEKEYFNFSCAHFLIFEDGTREPLHGHNYWAWVEVEGSLGPGHYVLDYITFKPIVKRICDDLDHKMLIPARSEFLKVESEGGQIRIEHHLGGGFSFPEEDSLVLEIANTSTELLANHIAHRIYEELTKQGKSGHLTTITVGVEEAPGQQSSFRYDVPVDL